jgi:predicted ArsR family transcriptional regulator
MTVGPWLGFHRRLCKVESMDVPRHGSDALAQPTRAKIFGLVGELHGPVSTDELAARLGLHPNGVRLHLDRLLRAGLVARERSRQGRGRPRDLWTVAPDARPGGDPPTGYEDLSRWLARATPSSRVGLRRTMDTGREVGRDLAPKEARRPSEERMHATLSALGFAPRRMLGETTLTYELCNCPYRDAVIENRDAICGLHRGITQGLLDELSPKTRLSAFVPKDPDTAGCLIELQGPMADEAANRDARLGGATALSPMSVGEPTGPAQSKPRRAGARQRRAASGE